MSQIDPHMASSYFEVALIVGSSASFLYIASLVVRQVRRGAQRVLAWLSGLAIAFIGILVFGSFGLVVLGATSKEKIWNLLGQDSFAGAAGLFAVLYGVVGTFAAVDALRKTQLDTAAYAFLELRNRYHSDEMGIAIRLLADFGVPIKVKHLAEWNELLSHPNERSLRKIGAWLLEARETLTPLEQDKLKSATRRVSSYFDDVAFLFIHDILPKRVTRSFVNLAGLNIYYEVCVPLHIVANASAPSIDYARRLRTVASRQGKGMIPAY